METRVAYLDPSADGPSDWRTRVVARSLATAAEKAVKRGETLITAARRLIHEGGAEDLTMQRVAAEAGLSLRVLYQYFASKDDLLIAIVEESQVAFAESLRRCAAGYDNPLDRFGAVLYFATDHRTYLGQNYVTAIAKYSGQTALSSPLQLGQARRPILEVLVELVGGLGDAGLIDIETAADIEAAAANVYLAYLSFSVNTVIGGAIGGKLPSQQQFVRFCAGGLGIPLERGWENRFTLTDEQARIRYDDEMYPILAISGAAQPARSPRRR